VGGGGGGGGGAPPPDGRAPRTAFTGTSTKSSALDRPALGVIDEAPDARDRPCRAIDGGRSEPCDAAFEARE